MLKTINLCKTYRPKKGVPVKALDGINLQFPDKGMVFILGKSGSGKSTLLNVLGGLDSYNSGEIVIKGTSSKDFKQRDFDSYRNTYIGFIFQEYNILDEFTVGANIALAIELQNRKATSEEINKILKEVDLEGYGNRKPNELSGGQKQRVAIARALVKNPEIIMADEPTGALDSNTGKQVFDTLKELSKDKLVIIVSHDRDFSEKYADRIIELADGKIISDVEKEDVNETEKENKLVFENGEIIVPHKYVLTEKDLKDINIYLAGINKDSILKSKKVVKGYTFKETDTKNIKVSQSNNFKLIKSKLPIKSAAKIGCSSLKHKPFRLIVTILLSVVSFTLFGLTDTIASFNKIDSAVNSIIDSKVNYVCFNRLKKQGSDEYAYWNNGGNLTEEERLSIQNEVAVDLLGVIESYDIGRNFENNFKKQKSSGQFFSYTPRNFYNLTENNMEKMGYNLLKGELPKNKDEIAITKLHFMYFKEFGYKYISKDNIEPEIEIDANDVTLDNIVGKKINLMSEENIYLDFTITGIVDTGLNEKRYEILKKDALTDKDMLNFWLINSEYTTLLENGLDFAFILSESGLKFIQEKNSELNSKNGKSFDINFMKDYFGRIEIFKNIDNVEDSFINNIKYFDNQKESLSDTSNQVVVGKNILNSIIAKDYQGKELDNEDKLVNSNIRISVTNLSEYIGKINNINVWKYVLAHPEEVNDFIEENNLGSVLENYNEYYYNNRYSYIAEENEVIENVKSDYIRIINKYIGNSIPIEVYISNFNLSIYKDNVSLEIVGVCEDYSYLENENTNYFNTVIYGKSVAKYFQENPYSILVGAMPSSASEIRKIVKFNYKEFDGIRYELNNPAMGTVNMLSDTLESLATIFLYVGLGLMIFAIVMLSNFIVVSISYKKVEIGILRAIGSRSNDVFRIFFSESFVIAMINFVLSFIGTLVVVIALNSTFRTTYGLLITILNIGIRQILLLFGVSLLIALVASYLPVKKIASKKPIDAIRNR